MPIRAATVVQVMQDLFYVLLPVLLQVLFYLWPLLNVHSKPAGSHLCFLHARDEDLHYRNLRIIGIYVI